MNWRAGCLVLGVLSTLPINAIADTPHRVELRISGNSYLILENVVVRREGDSLVIESDEPLPVGVGTDCRVDVSDHGVLNIDALAAERIAVYARDHARVQVGSLACGSAANVATGFGRIRQVTSE